MRKTELSVIFLKTGLLNKHITTIVSQNNEGMNVFLLSDIYGYAVCMAHEYPFVLKDIKVVLKENKMSIMENGKDINVIIEEKKIR